MKTPYIITGNDIKVKLPFLLVLSIPSHIDFFVSWKLFFFDMAFRFRVSCAYGGLFMPRQKNIAMIIKAFLTIANRIPIVISGMSKLLSFPLSDVDWEIVIISIHVVG